jgi:hypothetical protein
LKNLAKDPSQLAHCQVLAYALLNIKYSDWSQLNIKYSGWYRRISFDDYIAVYQQAFIKLSYLGEVISETKQVNDFSRNIINPKFSTIKTFITGYAHINSSFGFF